MDFCWVSHLSLRFVKGFPMVCSEGVFFLGLATVFFLGQKEQRDQTPWFLFYLFLEPNHLFFFLDLVRLFWSYFLREEHSKMRRLHWDSPVSDLEESKTNCFHPPFRPSCFGFISQWCVIHDSYPAFFT